MKSTQAWPDNGGTWIWERARFAANYDLAARAQGGLDRPGVRVRFVRPERRQQPQKAPIAGGVTTALCPRSMSSMCPIRPCPAATLPLSWP